MKTTYLLVVVFLLVGGAASVAVAQTPAIAHDTWTSGAPMPTATTTTAVGVIKGQIYAVGGPTAQGNGCLTNTQIYDPATNAWSAGAPLPIGTCNGASAAVVKNILYVFGGSTSEGLTSAVWAYNPKTNSWSSRSPMPTAKGCSGAAVENDIVYVIGGCGENPQDRLTDVESYDPATDTWTEEAPLLVGKSQPSVGRLGNNLVGFTIVAADGYTLQSDTGDNEGYSASANMWWSLTSDPNARNGACTGAIGEKLYVAGGSNGYWPAWSLTESFNLAKDTWKTLASMPQATLFPGSAVYKGQLYCIGGMYTGGDFLNNVQIYQP